METQTQTHNRTDAQRSTEAHTHTRSDEASSSSKTTLFAVCWCWWIIFMMVRALRNMVVMMMMMMMMMILMMMTTIVMTKMRSGGRSRWSGRAEGSAEAGGSLAPKVETLDDLLVPCPSRLVSARVGCVASFETCDARCSSGPAMLREEAFPLSKAALQPQLFAQSQHPSVVSCAIRSLAQSLIVYPNPCSPSTLFPEPVAALRFSVVPSSNRVSCSLSLQKLDLTSPTVPRIFLSVLKASSSVGLRRALTSVLRAARRRVRRRCWVCWRRRARARSGARRR
eukprot:2633416-Rhodomonas_salina.1